MSLPAPLRFINQVGRSWRKLGGPVRALEPDALIAEACGATGRSELGVDDGWKQGLTRICEDMAPQDHLSTVGRLVLRRHLLNSLRQRAMWLGWREREPERFATELRPPLIVVGLPRTGTTFLHRLLSSVKGARALPMWQVAEPFPPLDGPDLRRQRNQRSSAAMHRSLKAFQAKHATDADAPEECMHTMAPAFYSWTWWSTWRARGHLKWMRGADPAPAYGLWGDLLRHLQSTDTQQRFVLKSPSHTAHLATLMAELPQARIVWCRRKPEAVVPSYASLVETLRTIAMPKGSTEGRAELGAEVLAHLRDVSKRAHQQADAVPTSQRVNVDFADLVSDPVAVVRRIHGAFDLPFDEAQVAAEVANRPRNKHGKHRYSLKDYGLQDAVLDEL